MHDITAACLNGDFAKAADEQIKYTGLMNALFSDVNPIPRKEAMNILGMKVGPCRLPLYKMADAPRENLIKMLAECGLK